MGTQHVVSNLRLRYSTNKSLNSKCISIINSYESNRTHQRNQFSRRSHATGWAAEPIMERWAWRRPPKRLWMGGVDDGGSKGEGTNSKPSTGNCRSFQQGAEHQSSVHDKTTRKGCPDVPEQQKIWMKALTSQKISFPSVLTILMVLGLATILAGPNPADAVVPLFHEATKMSGLRLPADTAVETIVYRLRASDAEKNYPLQFGIRGTIGKNLIYITQHDCTQSNSIFCEADVFLRRSVEAGRVYIFNLTVADTTGDQTEVAARIDGTYGRSPINTIFLNYEPSVLVPEDQPLQTEVASLVVRKRRSASFVEFDMLGETAHQFAISGKLVSADEVRGSLVLDGQLDYETRNLHTLKICAMTMEPPNYRPIFAQNPYTDEQIDTRNIACVGIAVAVDDIQDMPPIFVNAPPVTRIPPSIQEGDTLVVLQAKDGDQGKPRPIRFSLLPSSSEYANFFTIDPFTGIVKMVETITRLMEKMVTMEPILMTVTAEEVETAVTQYPALSTEIIVAFVLVDSDLPLPKFVYDKYTGEIRENSPPDSQIYFANPFLSRGVKGVFSLSIEGDDGIFTVNPSVIRDSSDFVINVKNSALLDHESRKSIEFTLIARPVTGARHTSSTAQITVKVLDTNDNPPVFSTDLYQATFYENITSGTSIIKVSATDLDSTKEYGSVRYTRINGRMADRLALDPITGLITCATTNHDFDRDHNSAEYQLTVEARDDDGSGNSATARLFLRVKDVNDEIPHFKREVYTGVLEPNFQNLRDPIVVEAIDDDAEEPNNQLTYSLDRTADSHYFTIDPVSGSITVRFGVQLPQLALKRDKLVTKLDGKSRKPRQIANYDPLNTDYITLSARATDLGSPPLTKAVTVRVFRKEYTEMLMTFIYPMSETEVRLNQNSVERTLNTLTGASTDIQRIEPYRPGLFNQQETNGKSYITALVRTRVNNVVDVDEISRKLVNATNEPLVQKQLNQATQIRELESARTSYLTMTVLLCLLLAALILTLIACCICPSCPLYRGRKQMSMVTDENGEGISYIKMDEYGNPRPDQEKIWWDYLPNCLTDMFLSCGCQRPDAGRYTNNSRMAWSADGRQRYWNVQQQPSGGLVEDGAMPRRQPREMMHVEDFDEARLHRQNGMQAVQQAAVQQHAVNSTNGEGGDMPRKLFLIKDGTGNHQPTDHLQEGETYFVQDVNETPRNIHLQDTQGSDGNGDYGRNPGNGENLRLHAGPRDAALLAEQLRRSRRAGVEPGGSQYLHGDEGGGGASSRYVDGQSNGVTPRSEYYEDYTSNGTNYVHGVASDANSQAGENRRRKPDDTVVPRLRIRSPNEEELMEDIEDSLKTNRGKAHAHRHNRPDFPKGSISDRDLHAYMEKSPNSYGYQHTKASILRYESNMAKLEEDQQKEAEKDPLYNTLRRNSAVQSEARRAAAYAAEDDSLETRRTLSQAALELKQRRDVVGLSYDKPEELERSGSVPNIQTNLEREAAQRSYSRRGSLAEDEYYDEKNRKMKRSDKKQSSLRSSKGKRDKSNDNVDESQSNLPDDAKTKSASTIQGEMSADALRALEEEMKKDSEEGLEASKAATDRSRKKRNAMTEKKSVFTIAYDDMQTNQLRPESAAGDL